MVKPRYIPNRGDIILIDFNPTRGHEQSNVRPALVLSDKTYNQKTNLAVVCPITSQSKGYPFEVFVQEKKITGVVLSDHVRTLDWHVRNARFIQKSSEEVSAEVAAKLSALLFG